MKKYLCLLGAMLYLFTAFAQHSVAYTVSDSDASKYKRNVLYLEPINFLPLGVPKFTPGIKVEAFASERLMPWVQLKYTVLDMSWRDRVTGTPIDVNGHKAPMTMEGGGAFFFVNATRAKNLKVIVGRSYGFTYGTRSYNYIRVPSRVKYMLGIRGGYNRERKTLALDNESAQKMYNYKNLNDSAQLVVPVLYTTAYTSSVFTGLHYRKVTYTRIKIGERNRANALVTDIFADVFFPVSRSISHVTDDYFGEMQVVPKGYAVTNMGWRFGISERPSKGRLFQGSLVFGQHPGPAVNNGHGFYFLGNVGFLLSMDKHKGEKVGQGS